MGAEGFFPYCFGFLGLKDEKVIFLYGQAPLLVWLDVFCLLKDF